MNDYSDYNSPDSYKSGVEPDRDEKQVNDFTVRPATYIVLIFLAILFPGLGLLLQLPGSYEINYEELDPVFWIYIPLLIIQWAIFLVIWLAAWREGGGLKSLGFDRLRWRYLGYALLFVIISNMILRFLQSIVEYIGLSISTDVEEIVAQAGDYTGWWLAVSITAGICEETAFRGYLLTRAKAVTRRGWTIPVILSVMAFGAGHLYQGWGGLILISIYGLMFCWLYIKTRSLWPAIIAHFIQDFMAIYILKLSGS